MTKTRILIVFLMMSFMSVVSHADELDELESPISEYNFTEGFYDYSWYENQKDEFGFGDWIDYSFEDGDRYTGFESNGYFSDWGIYYFFNGGIREGQIEMDRFNGYGVYVSPDNGYIYEGEFRNGQFDGLGVIAIGDSLVFGQFENGSVNGYGVFYENGEMLGYGMFSHNQIIEDGSQHSVMADGFESYGYDLDGASVKGEGIAIYNNGVIIGGYPDEGSEKSLTYIEDKGELDIELTVNGETIGAYFGSTIFNADPNAINYVIINYENGIITEAIERFSDGTWRVGHFINDGEDIIDGASITSEDVASIEQITSDEILNELDLTVLEEGEETFKFEPSISEFEGYVSEEDRICEFSYQAPREGKYYFEIKFENEKSLLYTTFSNDSENIKWETSEGLTVDLNESEVCTIQVICYVGASNITLQVCEQREVEDISNAGVVQDEFLFEDQVNIYRFTAPVDGIYFMDIDTNSLTIEPNNGSETENHSRIMKAGDTYTVWVSCTRQVGSYQFNISFKETSPTNVSLYTMIHDTFYGIRENVYTFRAPFEGVYKYNFCDLTKAVNISFVNTENNEEILNEQIVPEEETETVSVALKSDTVYQMIINRVDSEKSDTRYRYDIEISYPRQATDYLNYFHDGLINQDMEFLD